MVKGMEGEKKEGSVNSLLSPLMKEPNPIDKGGVPLI
jgi:hypothetical protein